MPEYWLDLKCSRCNHIFALRPAKATGEMVQCPKCDANFVANSKSGLDAEACIIATESEMAERNRWEELNDRASALVLEWVFENARSPESVQVKMKDDVEPDPLARLIHRIMRSLDASYKEGRKSTSTN